MNLISTIRSGQSGDAHVPRAQFKKLWNWCRKHSENGRVGVRVYDSNNYSVLRDESRVRIGRATPRIKVRPRWDILESRNVIHYSDIIWSYVQ